MKLNNAYVYLGAAVLLWSTQAIVTKSVVMDIGPPMFTLYAFFFTFLGAVAITIAKKRTHFLASYKQKDLLPLLAIGGAWTLSSFMYYNAFLFVPASEAITLRYTWPLMLAFMGAYAAKTRVTGKQWLALLLGLAAVYLIGSHGGVLQPNFENPFADILILASAVGWSIFLTVEKKFKFESYSSMAISLFLGLIVVTTITVPFSGFSIPPLNDLLLTAYFGVVTGALGTVLYAKALRLGNTAEIANLSFLTPFAAVVLAVLLLGEQFIWYYPIALVLVLMGVFVQRKEAVANPARIIEESEGIFDVTSGFAGTSSVTLYDLLRNEQRVFVMHVPDSREALPEKFALPGGTAARFLVAGPPGLRSDWNPKEIDFIEEELKAESGDAIIFGVGESKETLAQFARLSAALQKE